MTAAYTDMVPLRSSTEWPEYPAEYPLQVVYGRVTLRPQPYDSSGVFWLIAGHPIQGIDSVTVDGQEIDGYALQNGVDKLGLPVAVLELANPVDDRSKITVSVRGKQHPDTGELLNRPDLILYDWLVNVCGMDYAVSDFDDLRAWSQSTSIICGGVVDTVESIQRATDRIAAGMGLAWGANVEGVAIPWPPESVSAGQVELGYINTPRLTAQCESTGIVTALNYSYAHDWAEGKPGRAMVLESESIERYGRRDGQVSAGWIQSTAAAEAHASRWLAWYGSAVWAVECDTSETVSPGESVSISHPYSPIDAAIVTEVTGGELGSTAKALASDGLAGAISIVSRSSGVSLESQGQSNYVYADGKLTYTVTDASGNPISRASVTLDGATTRLTDNQGKVQFTVGRGSHELVIDAAGYMTQTVTVTL